MKNKKKYRAAFKKSPSYRVTSFYFKQRTQNLIKEIQRLTGKTQNEVVNEATLNYRCELAFATPPKKVASRTIGYRFSNETKKLIKEIRNLTGKTQDQAVHAALIKYKKIIT